MARNCVKHLPSLMNKRVSVQSRTRTADGQGGFTEAWETDFTIWASIKPVKGYEKFQASQMQTPVSHKVVVRYRSGITSAQRLLYGSRVFDIKEVINEYEDNTFLKIIALELST